MRLISSQCRTGGKATALEKRGTVSIPSNFKQYWMACSYAENSQYRGALFQDCFITAGFLCISSSPGFNRDNCINFYKSIQQNSAVHSAYRDYFKFCSPRISYSSNGCQNAKSQLLDLVYYDSLGTAFPVTQTLIDSVNPVFQL